MSKAFQKLCGYFFQDIGVDNPDQGRWIDFAAQHLNADERRDVKVFLGEVLDSSKTDYDLQTMWFESSAEIYFPDSADLRGFLEMICKRIRE